MMDPETPGPDREEHYLEREEVAANLSTYLDVLEVERRTIEATKRALEDGRIDVDQMVEVLPDPMPLEAWEADQFDAEADYSPDLGDEEPASEWFTVRQRPDVEVEAYGPVGSPVDTDEGQAEPGQYVLKDPNGATYPCDSYTFGKRYEEVGDE